MRTSGWAAVLLSGMLGAMAKDYNCELEDLGKCDYDKRKEYQTAIVKNETELRAFCSYEQVVATCVSNELYRCFPENEEFLSDFDKEIVLDICVENSEARKVYLEHLSCFNKYIDDVLNCATIEQRAVEEWYREAKKHSPVERKDIERQSCMRYESKSICSCRVIQNACPGEGADMFKQMLTRIRNFFRRFPHCEKFYSNDAAFISRDSFSLLITAAILITIIETFRIRC